MNIEVVKNEYWLDIHVLSLYDALKMQKEIIPTFSIGAIIYLEDELR